ncbi:MAG: hypothetical protein HYX78_03790 [Armatimonadetes bacterium]|nr:hypothetical protein [Armatimonadota bacterium]
MNVTLAVMADYANLSQDGKLNILGIFNEIKPPQLPFALPTMFLVISFNASPAEVGSNKTIEVKLLDDEARPMLGIEQSLVVPEPSRTGSSTEFNTIIGLNGVRFEHPGHYQFSVLVGGEEKRALSLLVSEPPAKKEM